MTEVDLQQKAKEARNRYQQEWRAKNKDRVKAANARYWEKRVLKLAAEQEGTNASSND